MKSQVLKPCLWFEFFYLGPENWLFFFAKKLRVRLKRKKESELFAAVCCFVLARCLFGTSCSLFVLSFWCRFILPVLNHNLSLFSLIGLIFRHFVAFSRWFCYKLSFLYCLFSFVVCFVFVVLLFNMLVEELCFLFFFFLFCFLLLLFFCCYFLLFLLFFCLIC